MQGGQSRTEPRSHNIFPATPVRKRGVQSPSAALHPRAAITSLKYLKNVYLKRLPFREVAFMGHLQYLDSFL